MSVVLLSKNYYFNIITIFGDLMTLKLKSLNGWNIVEMSI